MEYSEEKEEGRVEPFLYTRHGRILGSCQVGKPLAIDQGEEKEEEEEEEEEAAVHAMTRLFEENDSTEGVLLVDVSNAFNSLNRGVMLRNIRKLCPAFSTCVTNYRSSASLSVGETIQSLEGTTQGDPLAMAIYALAILPLINRAKLSAGNATQCWFADDAGAGGKLQDLFNWWCVLAEKGPLYGYFVNPPKTWPVVKDCRYASATALFQNSGIQNHRRTAPPWCASW